jgi:hypothetical protein
MASTVANKFKYALATKQIDFSGDTFKIILMQSGFTFNKDAHHGYADVSASELATGYGYTAGGNTLSGVVVTENDTTDLTEITWNNSSWTASLGAIGPTPGAIIYDDTPTTPQADPIVGYIDFGSDQTEPDGGVATVANIEVDI